MANWCLKDHRKWKWVDTLPVHSLLKNILGNAFIQTDCKGTELYRQFHLMLWMISNIEMMYIAIYYSLSQLDEEMKHINSKTMSKQQKYHIMQPYMKSKQSIEQSIWGFLTLAKAPTVTPQTILSFITSMEPILHCQ